MERAIRIREADRSDRELLLGFHRGLYQDHRDRVVPKGDLPLLEYRDYERVLRDDIQTLLSDENGVVLIAEAGDAPVGYITGRVTVEPQRVLPRRGVIEDWFVIPESRGSGVGRLLLGEIERRFTASGCQVVESATWPTNEGARKAHDALGFREIRVIYRKRL